MFTTVFWITGTAFVTAIAGIIAALPVIWEPSKKGLIKFNFRGYVFISCSILLVILPGTLYVIQSRSDKDERDTRDAALRKEYQASVAKQLREYQASVSQIRRDFGDSNNRTLTVIGQTLAKYGLRLDTTEKRLTKVLRDSANIKTVLPNQPVLQVVTDPNGPAIKFLKIEDGLNHYSITFVSMDGASCCYDLKMSAVVLDSNLNRMAYKSPLRMALTNDDALASGETQNWTFTINNSHPYDWLYLWVRGTYGDRNNTHTYHFDKVYYNRKLAKTAGSMGADVSNEVKELVHRFEKD